MPPRGTPIPPPNPHGTPPPMVPRDAPVVSPGNQGHQTITLPPRGGGLDLPPPITDPPPLDDELTDQILPSDRATQRTNPEPRSRELTTTSPEGDCIPVHFGKDRSGGDLIYCESDGISKIYIAISFGEGENFSLSDFEIDNFPGEKFGLFVGSSHFNVYLGTPDQPLDPILSGYDPEGWFSAYPGLCYCTLMLDINVPDNQTINPLNIKATIEGLLSPDHRQDDTLDTLYYHQNPALALAHLFLDQRWGFQADTTQMDWLSWDESADDCEVVLASATDGEPTTAPTVAVSGGGIIGPIVGWVYEWGYTWLYADGVESTLSPASSDIAVTVSQRNFAVDVTDLDQGTADVIGIRIYRRIQINSSWASWNFVTELNPKAETFHDNTHDVFHGGTHPPGSNDKAQFRIGLKMDTQRPMGDWVTTIRTLFTAFVAFNNGQYQCRVDKVRDATDFTYDESNITGNLEVLSVGIAEIPGSVQVKFVDQDNGFLDDVKQFPEGEPLAGDVIARKERRDFIFECQGCPSGAQASYIAQWAYNRGQRPYRIRLRTRQKGILPLPGSIISVSHVAHDFGTASCIVTSTGPVEDTLGWNLAMEIYDVNDYTYNYDNGFTPHGGGGGGGVDPPPPPPPPGSDIAIRAQFWMDQHYQPGLGG